MSTHIHHEGTSCQCMARSAAYSQNFDEMDFTRGIWSAAMNGEVDRVQNYLDKKCSPDALDSSGYTALVYYLIYSVYETKIFLALCERTFKTVIQVLL